MNFYTFRISDGVHLYTAYSEEQQVGQWTACLANEGGAAADFIVKEYPDRVPQGRLPVMAGGHIEDPAEAVRQNERAQIHAKLIGLGFTPEQAQQIA